MGHLRYGEEGKVIFYKWILFTYLSAYGGEVLVWTDTMDSSGMLEV